MYERTRASLRNGDLLATEGRGLSPPRSISRDAGGCSRARGDRFRRLRVQSGWPAPPESPPARLPAPPQPSLAAEGPARTPHTHAAAPPGLTPVPLSHTTTFLPWLSMVRPGEPPPGLACFLLHTAPPSARRSAQTGSPRPAAAPRGRCRGQKKNGDWQLRKPIRAARRGHGRALSPRSASGAAQSWWGGGSDQGVSGPRARPAGCTGGRQAGEGRRVCGGAAVEKGGAAS